MKRSPVKAKRSTPRRREAPRWTHTEWESANQTLYARSGGLCERCGKTPWTERHHRKRRRDGGDRLCNILGLCSHCHRTVTEHPGEARRYGFIVSAYADPAVIPVLWRQREWFLLDDDGNKLTLPYETDDAHSEGAATLTE